MVSAKRGDLVKVQLTRSVQRAAPPKNPADPSIVEFTVGSRDVIRGLSLGVMGMAQGERKRLVVPPADAYGAVQPNLVKEIPRGRFPKDLSLKVGKRLIAKGGTLRRRRVRIVEINPQSVLIDGNHALAGKTIELEVLLLSLQASTGKRARSEPKPKSED